MTQFFKVLYTSTVLLTFSSSSSYAATAPVRYRVTITNGGGMPISPGALYVKSGESSSSSLGTSPTSGFIRLCQTGNATDRSTELRADRTVSQSMVTQGPILPGSSITQVISVNQPSLESIQFEAMYGKSKDACAVFSVQSHSLVALMSHVAPATILHDRVVQTGAFVNARAPAYGTRSCEQATTAVDCLRELSTPLSTPGKIKAFQPYLPKLLGFLEERYDSSDVETLQIPTAGALQIQVTLVH